MAGVAPSRSDGPGVPLKTSGPAASLLANLAFVFILPKADYQAKGAETFGQKPIGSGPYKVERWDKGQRIVLAAFDAYWGGKKAPARIVIRQIAEGSTRLAELLTGGVDVIQDLPVENVQQVRESKDLAVVQAKGIRQIFFPIGMIRWSRQYDSDTIIAGIQAQSTTQKWYANEEVDKLIVKARETLDRAAREKVYQELYKAMVEDPG